MVNLNAKSASPDSLAKLDNRPSQLQQIKDSLSLSSIRTLARHSHQYYQAISTTIASYANLLHTAPHLLGSGATPNQVSPEDRVNQLLETIDGLQKDSINTKTITRLHHATQALLSPEYKALIPDNLVFIGLAMQGSSGNSREVNTCALDYVNKLPQVTTSIQAKPQTETTDKTKTTEKKIIVVPLESSHIHNDNLYHANKTLKDVSQLKALVKNDIQRLNGIVIPGDWYNMPAIKETDNPYETLLSYDGIKHNGNNKTIYTKNGKNLTEAEFNQAYPDHYLNTDPSVIHYETEFLKQITDTDIPVMCSCHGAQMFALMRGANMVAGLKGHAEASDSDIEDSILPTLETKIKPNSMAIGYMPDEKWNETNKDEVLDDRSISDHILAIAPQKRGDGLRVVGQSSDGVVKILETETELKPSYLYQTHPEQSKEGTPPIHNALKAFVGSAIQHQTKRNVASELLQEGLDKPV